LTLIIFAFGLVLGSFINVVIYRLPRRLSLVAPGSRCPYCQTPIRPLDNIPIVSFLLLRGRCRHCRKGISWRYPLVEASAGVVLAILWWRIAPSGAWGEFVAGAVFALILLAVFFIDLEHQIVPNRITYPGLIVGLLFALMQGRLLPSVLAAFGAGAFFFLVAVVSRGGMGGGDIKLAAVMGAFLGWPGIAVALFVAFTVGASAGVFLMLIKRRGRKDAIPFGPSLAVGGIAALLAGDALIRWYFGTSPPILQALASVLL
jgi:leader peptidase (prepilin peptidase) / N-methyltransferase